MRLALRLARKADPFPNPRVGAVLVKDGVLLGVGYHKGPGLPHAEIAAIDDAKKRWKDPAIARGADLYVTLEPCSHTAKRTPPCTQAIIREGIRKVFFAMKDPNPLVSGARELRHAGIKVAGPSMQKDAWAINRRYISNIRKMPQIAIKMAMSADGKTATRRGDSSWISSKDSRDMVHRMRAQSDALIVGAGTVIHDDPALTAHGKGRDPWRVVVDGRLSIPPGSRVLRMKDGRTIVATCEKAEVKRIAAMRKRAQVFVCGKDSVDLQMLVRGLSAMGMKKIIIEGGSELNMKALESGIVSRLPVRGPENHRRAGCVAGLRGPRNRTYGRSVESQAEEDEPRGRGYPA